MIADALQEHCSVLAVFTSDRHEEGKMSARLEEAQAPAP